MTQETLFGEKKEIEKPIIHREEKKEDYKENYFTKEKLKDKKVIIVIEKNYTYDWSFDILERKPEEHLNGWYEGDYDGCLGGCGSEGWEDKNVDKPMTLEEKKAKMIKWLKEMLLDDGYNEKNISIKEIPFNEKEELEKWKADYKKDIEREQEYAEKEIKEYKDKLTRAIKITNFNI